MKDYIEHKYNKYRMESDIKDLEEQIEEEKRVSKVLEESVAYKLLFYFCLSRSLQSNYLS